jgi:hypothetical protein
MSDQPFSRPPAGLPRQRRGTAPQGRSRYPDFDVLEQARHWDEATRQVVLARVEQPPPLRFFDEDEARTLRAFCDVATAQDEEPRVPVLEMVDAKLFDGRLDGFQHADMPDDRDVWRLAARGLDERARAAGAVPVFVFLPQVREGLWQEETQETLRIAEAAGFAVISLADIYKTLDINTVRLAEWDDHPNTRGHELIAARLYDALRAKWSAIMQPNSTDLKLTSGG